MPTAPSSQAPGDASTVPKPAKKNRKPRSAPAQALAARNGKVCSLCVTCRECRQDPQAVCDLCRRCRVCRPGGSSEDCGGKAGFMC